MGKVKELMYGDTIENVQQLRQIMSELDDHDQLTLVTCDTETGDEQDHYPMAVDVIGNIRLTDDTIVREVQFVQRPNCPPDTRDKQKVVDALIDVLAEDIAKGDTTVLDELLLRMPYDVLKYALPEDMWADFEENVRPDGAVLIPVPEPDPREVLIDKVMFECYGDDDVKYYNSNRAYLETLSNDELEKKL